MHIYKDLFCDEATFKQRKKILRKIKYHAGLTNTYIIALSQGNDYFDLIPGYVFKQKQYPVKDMHIMGLADGYDSAISLVTDMIGKFYDKHGTYQFKQYILQNKELDFTGYRRKY